MFKTVARALGLVPAAGTAAPVARPAEPAEMMTEPVAWTPEPVEMTTDLVEVTTELAARTAEPVDMTTDLVEVTTEPAASTAEPVAGTAAGSSPAWPPLPSRGFITGRAADSADFENGDAIFVAAFDDRVIGQPIPIEIPQYACLRGTRERVIVVQAEYAKGLRLYGVRGLDGKQAVLKDDELELLGTRIAD